MPKVSEASGRFLEIDIIRGICIILMLFDHFFLISFLIITQKVPGITTDSSFYNMLTAYTQNTARGYIRYIILFLFFIVSGISTYFSKNNIRRAYRLTVAATAVSVFSLVLYYVLQIFQIVYFGVIHFYAVSVCIYVLIQKITDIRIRIVIWLVLIGISATIFSIQGTPIKTNVFFILGLTEAGFNTGFDYVPIFPNIAVFIAGVTVGKICYEGSQPKLNKNAQKYFASVSFVGKHGQIIYLVHIPLYILIAYIISRSLLL